MSVSVQTQTVAASILNRKGYIAISLDSWSDSNEPTITEGSIFECGGSIYSCNADEDIDPGGAWAGIGNDTLTYVYFNPNSLIFVITTTAPTWDDQQQGYYDATNTHRYLLTIYKDGSGNYTQKTIILDRERGITDSGISFLNSANEDKIIRFASDAYIQWDESEGSFSYSPRMFPYAIYEDQKSSKTTE